ncbi:MAG: 30S ribosomal protein S12 methylthiotransferase RimO [Lachnospiraceae bacterium]|nr:30S ribosomal protein S12 methylthiotransferase RimO [Lachnospiraceae bacterium]
MKTTTLMFISLGCDKNLVDTEHMLGILGREGFEFTQDETQADIIVINSCCFIGDAKEESINTIIETGKLKETGRLKGLIVCGCLAQRYAGDIRRELPEVDAIVGTTEYTRIAEAVKEVLEGNSPELVGNTDAAEYPKGERILTGGGYSSYLKISEGCDKNCTYCIIPKVRGRYRSFPEEVLLNEARSLAEKGVKELVLVAQETTVYGRDIYGKKRLPDLLKKLCGIEGLEWIRIMYSYPEEIDDALIDVMSSEEKVCHYLDMPIQHCSDRILRLMGRRTDRKSLEKTIKKLRERIPDIALRTTLISGFPGETKKDHEELLSFVEEMRFDRLGVFAYSREEDTPAASFDGQVPVRTAKKRRDEIMSLQQRIAFEKEAGMAGREMTVMIEGSLAEDDVYVGRTYRDAPDVDGYVFLKNTPRRFMSGDLVKARITGANGYDLTGDII